ncbi:hypothetical protein B0H19DRAFT_1059897 [Mycena capillaripes]|nr:hypothetical protein B0H19DRAFT_1059897 [Mycena capillaripes]
MSVVDDGDQLLCPGQLLSTYSKFQPKIRDGINGIRPERIARHEHKHSMPEVELRLKWGYENHPIQNQPIQNGNNLSAGRCATTCGRRARGEFIVTCFMELPMKDPHVTDTEPHCSQNGQSRPLTFSSIEGVVRCAIDTQRDIGEPYGRRDDGYIMYCGSGPSTA